MRNGPWATFFDGVIATRKQSAAPLQSQSSTTVSTATGGLPAGARFYRMARPSTWQRRLTRQPEGQELSMEIVVLALQL